MWKTQTRFEENVTVINENTPTLSSGGVAIITNNTSVSLKMLILPDTSVFRESRKEGQYQYERLFAQVRKTEIEKASIIPGKTRIIWNGNTYKVFSKMDYTSKPKFKIAEIEMRRRIDSY